MYLLKMQQVNHPVNC